MSAKGGSASGGKKILIFSTAYFPLVGGAEIAVKEITDRIGDIKFDMLTARLSRKNLSHERTGNVNIYRFGIGWPLIDKYLLAFFGCFYAARIYKKNKYDLIWSIMASYGGFAAMFFKTFHSQVPYLLTLQEGDDLDCIDKRVWPLNWLFRQIFLKADYIQAISNYLASWAKKMGFEGEIGVVPNAVDIKYFSKEYSENEIKKLKDSLGKKSGDNYVITTSRLVLKNAVDDVIKSLVYLTGNIKFLVLGVGPEEKNLKALAKKLKVEKRIMFLGYIDHKEMPLYLRISDVFIRPSLSEGLGNSFLEAMAAGVPIISTPVGGIPDFLFDPKINPDKKSTGLFCHVRDPKSIAKKIETILSDKELTDKIIINAKELVFAKYDWDIITHNMNKIFYNLTRQNT